MRRTVLVTGIVLLAACSSSHKKAQSTTSTTTPATVPGATNSTTTSVPSPTTAPTSPTTASTPTTNGGGGSSVTVNGFSYSGSSPIECNAPTQIELKWTASGAKDVALSIDGGPAVAHYPNGARDELLPLACDGKSHTYTLSATAPGVNVTRSITVQTKSIA